MTEVIKVSNLSKRYRIGLKEKQSETLVGQIGNILKSPVDNLKKLRQMSRFGEEDESVFWALKDINFEVMQGEVLGIIGKNGAGKSTLLKILSQISEPTSGRIEIYGRVASLLEVGTGFHPELSGRDNIYMNGTILGMTKNEINFKLDEIIDFSGVEKFIDTPVKFYSSGMKVRLGFSVAAHLEPEILIIDEVLAVGDFEFQKKCLGKMHEVAGQGRTVLFVSHQMDAISRLCTRVLVLKNGELAFSGDSNNAIKNYFNHNKLSDSYIAWDKEVPENNYVSLHCIKLIDKNEECIEYIDIQNDFFVSIEFKIKIGKTKITPGINIHNQNGDFLFTSHDIQNSTTNQVFDIGVYETKVCIPGNLLAEGIMYVSVAFMSYDPFTVHLLEEKVLSISVQDKVTGNSARGIYAGSFPGLIRPILKWITIKKNE